jgi:O-antigen/teichoic acid export membrane protein
MALPTSILIARALGPDGKGVLALLQLTTQMVITFLGIGLSSAALYYAGSKRASGRDGVLLALGYGLLLSVALLALYPLLGGWLAADILHLSQKQLLIVAFALIAPALVVNVVYSFVIGFGSVRAATTVVNTSLTVQLAIYGTLFATHHLTLPVAVAVWATASVIEATAYSVLAWRHCSEASIGPVGLFKRMRGYSVVMWLSTLVGFAALRVDMFLLGYYKGSGQVGVYATAVTFAELLWFLPSALNAVIVPKVAGEGDDALAVSLRLMRLVLPVTIAAGLGVLGLASFAVPLLYGRDFSPAIPPLALLLPGIIMISAATIPTAWMAGSGKPLEPTKASAVNLVTNVIANVTLIPLIGASGAALSSSISYGAAAIFITASFLRHTKVSLREAFVPRPGEARDLARAALSILRRES